VSRPVGRILSLRLGDLGAHYLIVVNLIQNSPVAGPDSPCPRIPYKLCGLSRTGILRQSVNDAARLLLDRAVKALECLTRLVAEDDLVGHRLQASLSLDLVPGDNRLARFDAGASLAGCSGVSEVF